MSGVAWGRDEFEVVVDALAEVERVGLSRKGGSRQWNIWRGSEDAASAVGGVGCGKGEVFSHFIVLV